MVTMHQDFDPYYRWLGIPLEKQPPDHYCLLGLRPLEDDPDVIETAANRQMGHLRTYQTGKYSQLSQRLLNEVAAAKICLLNPNKKRAYDAILRAGLEAQATPPAPQPEPAPTPTYYDRLLVEAHAKLSQAEVRRLELQEGRRTWSAILFMGALVAAILAVPLAMFMVWLILRWNGPVAPASVPPAPPQASLELSTPSESPDERDGSGLASQPPAATTPTQGSSAPSDPNLLVVPEFLIEKSRSTGPRPE